MTTTTDTDTLVGIPTPRARLRSAIFQRILPRLIDSIVGGCLEVRLPDGITLSGGDNAGPTGRIVVNDWRCFAQIGARGQRGFGEAYVLGYWSSDDPATAIEVIARTMSARERRPSIVWLRRLQRLRPSWQRRNPPASAKRHIAYHYDLGNDFYSAFLDETMTYSCADFSTLPRGAAIDIDALHEGQLQKFASICQQLDIGPDDRVLEIGCGWGGFAAYCARTTGAHVTGVTISERQFEYATQMLQGAGLSERVDIQLRDYRTLEGQFTKIVSIEMLEAVGAREYGRYFSRVDHLLAPGGAALVQVIGFQDRDYERQLRVKGWIRRYVFPGGMLPTVNVLSKTMKRRTSLQIHALREIGQYYGPTCQIWRERLLAASDELEQLGYGLRLRRSWEFYLAFVQAGFDSGHIRNMQVLITHAGTVLPEPSQSVESQVARNAPSLASS